MLQTPKQHTPLKVFVIKLYLHWEAEAGELSSYNSLSKSQSRLSLGSCSLEHNALACLSAMHHGAPLRSY